MWLDGAIHFSTGPGEQKAINLRGNPHVTLTTGCNHWDRGLDVVIEGDAVQVTSDGKLERLAVAWTTKWDGRWLTGCLWLIAFPVRELRGFAAGMRRDWAAVTAGLTLSHSSGTVEGHVNRNFKDDQEADVRAGEPRPPAQAHPVRRLTPSRKVGQSQILMAAHSRRGRRQLLQHAG